MAFLKLIDKISEYITELSKNKVLSDEAYHSLITYLTDLDGSYRARLKKRIAEKDKLICPNCLKKFNEATAVLIVEPDGIKKYCFDCGNDRHNQEMAQELSEEQKKELDFETDQERNREYNEPIKMEDENDNE